jgi:hypothetical protein
LPKLFYKKIKRTRVLLGVIRRAEILEQRGNPPLLSRADEELLSESKPSRPGSTALVVTALQSDHWGLRPDLRRGVSGNCLFKLRLLALNVRPSMA